MGVQPITIPQSLAYVLNNAGDKSDVDFSYLLQKVPGAMFFLGVCPDDIANPLEAPSCHSNLMRLNEAALPLGVALHAGVALKYLASR